MTIRHYVDLGLKNSVSISKDVYDMGFRYVSDISILNKSLWIFLTKLVKCRSITTFFIWILHICNAYETFDMVQFDQNFKMWYQLVYQQDNQKSIGTINKELQRLQFFGPGPKAAVVDVDAIQGICYYMTISNKAKSLIIWGQMFNNVITTYEKSYNLKILKRMSKDCKYTLNKCN